jgi:hypothetical protein
MARENFWYARFKDLRLALAQVEWGVTHRQANSLGNVAALRSLDDPHPQSCHRRDVGASLGGAGVVERPVGTSKNHFWNSG